MITLKLSNIYSKLSSNKSKINKYINVLRIYDPADPKFQEDFAYFFALNPTDWIKNTSKIVGTGTWMDGITRKEAFFQILDKYMKMPKCTVTYSNIIQDLSSVPMRNGKGNVQISFSSKILHVIDNNKPIIDQKMLLKLSNSASGFTSSVGLKVTGKKKPVVHVGNGTICDAIKFYSDVETYYPKLISFNKQPKNSLETYMGNGKFDNKNQGKYLDKNATYFDNFNTWLHEQNITAPISDEKKADFWMWLA